MKSQAKFFCENCNEEVKQNARFCNKCGRFFSAVRCPLCGKVGSSNMFVNGCPACGYAEKDKNHKNNSAKNNNINNFSNYKNQKSHFYIHNQKAKKNINDNSSLPLWIYFTTFFALVFMIIFFMKCSY